MCCTRVDYDMFYNPWHQLTITWICVCYCYSTKGRFGLGGNQTFSDRKRHNVFLFLSFFSSQKARNVGTRFNKLFMSSRVLCSGYFYINFYRSYKSEVVTSSGTTPGIFISIDQRLYCICEILLITIDTKQSKCICLLNYTHLLCFLPIVINRISHI